MHTAPHPDSGGLNLLYLSLADYLHGVGVTITHAPVPNLDATWCAATATLTLREDADTTDQIAVLGDLVRMIALGDPSARGAYRPSPRPRHLRIVNPTSPN